MDHVPQIIDPVFPPVKVPCLSSKPYENKTGRFEDYPAQRGWDISLLKQGIFTQHSSEDTSVFLQDWLFFGVLHEVLDNAGMKEEFLMLDEQASQPIVTTKCLVPLLTALFRQVIARMSSSASDKAGIIADFDRMEGVLCTLAYFCNMSRSIECRDTPLKQFCWPLCPEIDLSIRALGQLLATGISTTMIPYKTCFSSSMKFLGGELALSRMRHAGWCPSDIAMISQDLSASSLYYASSLRRWQLRNDHSQCNRQACLASQIDTTTYETVHLYENCTCDHIHVDVSQLTSIIAKEGIPLITITVATSGEPVLEISPFRKGQQYIAISHVWSDGMGNLHQNSLPRCQLLRLKALIDELSWSNGRTLDNLNKTHLGKFWRRFRGQTIPFWLDTLCIPVGSQNKKYRKLAISLMYKTYVSAEDILVLDSELQNTPIPSDNTEIFLRVSISGWMRRLWTLQEGVLGHHIQVKFKDGVVDLVAKYNWETDPDTAPDYGKPWAFENRAGSLHAESRSFYWNFRSLRSSIVDQRERKFMGRINKYTPYLDPSKDKSLKECFAILDAFVSSNYRSSLRKADEYLCLSGLLGWDTACLDGVPIEHRMKTLLRERSVLPQGLLFIAGPRMREKGWRWALKDFGNNGSVQLSAHLARRDGTAAKLCSKGLIVEYPGFVIPPSRRPRTTNELFVEVPLLPEYPPVICRFRKHSISIQTETADSAYETNTEDPLPTTPLGLFYYDSTSVLVANVPMGAVMVEMDCADSDGEEPSSALEGALLCSYLHLAQMEILGYKEFAGAIYPKALQADVYSVPRESFGVKRWFVG